MKISAPLLAAIVLIISPLASAEVLYQTKNSDALGCNDQKITAESNYAAAHPGYLSDDQFFDIWTKGQCGPVSSKIALKLIRTESLPTPSGIKKFALVQIANPVNPGLVNDHFYLMLKDVEKIGFRKP